MGGAPKAGGDHNNCAQNRKDPPPKCGPLYPHHPCSIASSKRPLMPSPASHMLAGLAPHCTSPSVERAAQLRPLARPLSADKKDDDVVAMGLQASAVVSKRQSRSEAIYSIPLDIINPESIGLRVHSESWVVNPNKIIPQRTCHHQAEDTPS